MLRLPWKKLRNYPPNTWALYLELETMAGARDVLHVRWGDLPQEWTPRHVRRAFRDLRELGLSVDYERRNGTYRVAWPNSVDLTALYEHLRTYDAGQAYNFGVDTLRNVREAVPDMAPDTFWRAVASALISAHLSSIKSGNLQRWLIHGVQQEARYASSATATPSEKPPNQEGNQEWRKKVEHAMRNRPDLEKLYGPRAHKKT